MKCKDNHKGSTRPNRTTTHRAGSHNRGRTLRAENRARESDRGTHAHANQHVCTRTHTTNHPRTHAHMINGTGRSAGATPRRLTRRGRPTPTTAAVHRAEAGARRPGLPAPTTSVHTTPPLYPPAFHTSPTGKRSSRGGRRAKWGEVKRVRGAAVGIAAFRTGPGVPAGRWMGVHSPEGPPVWEPGPAS